MVKAKIKALKHARTKSPNAAAGPSTSADTAIPVDVEDPGASTPVAGPGSATPVARPGSPAAQLGSPVHPSSPSIRPSSPTTPAVPAPTRTELLRSNPELVGRYMRLMVPVLVDVYAASVATQTRSKSLAGILKAVSFAEDEEVNAVLKVCFICGYDISGLR
jgi:E3 ubiquitin-protein ligase TRIP12